jgi:hypothetical protein
VNARDDGASVTDIQQAALRRRRWMAVLFIAGSVLFAVGAVPAYSDAAGL